MTIVGNLGWFEKSNALITDTHRSRMGLAQWHKAQNPLFDPLFRGVPLRVPEGKSIIIIFPKIYNSCLVAGV